MRQHKYYIATLIVVICVAIVFYALWVRKSRDHSDLEQQCQYAARLAQDRFEDFRAKGSDYDYHYGVAQLVSFYDSYLLLTVETQGETNANCLYLNQLLGVLMDYPELTSEQVSQLVAITAILGRDISDANAFNQIFALYNQLTR